MEKLAITPFPKAFGHPDTTDPINLMIFKRLATVFLQNLKAANGITTKERCVVKEYFPERFAIQVDDGGSTSRNAQPSDTCVIAHDIAMYWPKLDRCSRRMPAYNRQRLLRPMTSKDIEDIYSVVFEGIDLNVVSEIGLLAEIQYR
jgi:hypothetical protein